MKYAATAWKGKQEGAVFIDVGNNNKKEEDAGPLLTAG